MRRSGHSRPHREATRVGDVMEGLLRTFPAGRRVRESLALSHWAQAVGPAAAVASEPERISDGVLFVRTKSSVWSQELSLLKSHIIERLNARIGSPVVQDIRFRARGDVPAAIPAEPGEPDAATIDAVALPSEDRDALATLARELRAMRDEQRRATVLHIVERRMKVRRWRLAHGARACPRCGLAYDEAGSVCPVCRLVG